MPILNVRSEFERALDRAIDQFISIGLGLLSIVIVIALARFFVRFTKRIFWKRIASTTTSSDAATLINNGISVCVYFAAVTLLLALWGASWSTLLTAISISTLAVVLGLQDLLRSMLGGAFVILDQPYSVGDRIEIAEQEGEVVEVRLRTTILRTSEGRKMSLPNAVVLTSALINLDREVLSSTAISVYGITGVRESVEASIQDALAVSPKVSATVTVSDEAPSTLKHALAKRFGLPARSAGMESGQAGPLHVNVMIAAGEDSRHVEQDTVNRMKELYPQAHITVRRAAQR